MASSIKHTKISGKIVQIVLSENDNEDVKVQCEITSEHTQIGDNNIANIPHQIETKDTTRLDMNEIPSREVCVDVDANCAQVVDPNNTCRNLTFYIDADIVQVGNNNKVTANKAEQDHVKARKKPQSKQRVRREAEDRQTTQISEKCVQLGNNFFEHVLSVLHPLRDNGNWDIFEDKLNEFRQRYREDPIWQILLTLEQGLVMCYHSYQSNIPEAEKVIEEELANLERLEDIDPSITRLCQSRAHCYLAAVYRRGKLFGKVETCLSVAESFFKDTDFLYDKAVIYYEKGSWPLECYADQKSVMKDCKNSFDECAKLCEQIHELGRYEFVRKGQFARLKKAMLLLDCSKGEGRKRKISDKCVEEAKKCLLDFEENNQRIPRGSTPISVQLQHLLAKSDRSYRSNDNEQTILQLQEFIRLAEEHGFDASPASSRLQDIQSSPPVGQANVTSTTGSPENAKASLRLSGDGDVSRTSSD